MSRRPYRWPAVLMPVVLITAVAAAGCGPAEPRSGTQARSGDAASRTAGLSPAPDGTEPAADDGRLRNKTFDDLKFDIEPGDPFEPGMLTDEIQTLFGKRIRLRGYILPTARKRLRQFVLVRDNQECCFGPGAALYDCVLVDMQPGEVAQFSVRPVAVEGTLSLDEFIGPDGTHLAIYHLEGERVE